MRRLLLVPFNAHFNSKNENKKIKSDYLKRKDILEYVLWKAINEVPKFECFIEPEVSKQMKADYDRETDSLTVFKKDVFDVGKFEVIPEKLVFQWYKSYCSLNGYTPIKKKYVFIRKFKQYISAEYTTSSSPIRVKANQRKKIIDFNKQCRNTGRGHFGDQKPFQGPSVCFIKRKGSNPDK